MSGCSRKARITWAWPSAAGCGRAATRRVRLCRAPSPPTFARRWSTRYFGHSSFRAGQQELVTAVLDGHDVLAVMPTGSGKSLGYQLPAVLLPGITLVISPLISLMKDQVDELSRRGIRAAALHSQTGIETRRDTYRAIRRGEIRLLYVAPERWIDAACAGGLVKVSEDRYRLLSLTPRGRDVMAGRAPDVVLSVPADRPGSRRRRGRDPVQVARRCVRDPCSSWPAGDVIERAAG